MAKKKDKQQVAKKEWHESYFQRYTKIIADGCHDREKRIRLIKKLIEWQANFDNLEGVK